MSGPTRVRIPHTSRTSLLDDDALVVTKRGGGERILEPEQYCVNRNTPVGEDADLYELKPHGGRRYRQWSDVIAILRGPAKPVKSIIPT